MGFEIKNLGALTAQAWHTIHAIPMILHVSAGRNICIRNLIVVRAWKCVELLMVFIYVYLCLFIYIYMDPKMQ